jgi:hypothetical protein
MQKDMPSARAALRIRACSSRDRWRRRFGELMGLPQVSGYAAFIAAEVAKSTG